MSSPKNFTQSSNEDLNRLLIFSRKGTEVSCWFLLTGYNFLPNVKPQLGRRPCHFQLLDVISHGKKWRLLNHKRIKGGRKSPSKTHQSLIFPMPLQRWEVGGKGESQIALSSRQFAFVVAATCQKRLYKTFWAGTALFLFFEPNPWQFIPLWRFLIPSFFVQSSTQ